MQKNPFTILGLTENASRAEIDEAYRKLKEKYQEAMFQEGEAGSVAADKLTEVENAYREVKTYFVRDNNDFMSTYADVENFIKRGCLQDAQDALDAMPNRDAEWHYYQSIVFYKKDWFYESKKQLEVALAMDSNNPKYRNALEKLNNLINGNTHFNNQNFNNQGNFNNQNNQGNFNNQGNQNMNKNNGQMGMCDEGGALNCCADLLCLNCLCNMCR